MNIDYLKSKVDTQKGQTMERQMEKIKLRNWKSEHQEKEWKNNHKEVGHKNKLSTYLNESIEGQWKSDLEKASQRIKYQASRKGR